MASINKQVLVLHQVHAKLYNNNLHTVDGAYIARTDNEKTLSMEDVCTTLKTRGGFTGTYEDLLHIIRQYNDEVAYQLCDGFAVTNGYYTIHPNIGGTFNSVGEAHDHEKHPISFRFGTRAKLKELVKTIVVNIDGIANAGGYIDTFTDFESDNDSVNGTFAPGNVFAIHGYKIKLEGDDPCVGVYFVPIEDPSKAVKVERIAENSATKISGIAPDTGFSQHRIEVRTQFTGFTGKFLKAPRVITSSFSIEAA